MKLFFLAFECTTATNHSYHNDIGGASAHCIALAIDPNSAFIEARFYIEKDNWQIETLECGPIEITEDQCQDDSDNLDLFKKACEQGIATRYMAWAKDESIYATWQKESIPSESIRLPLDFSSKSNIYSFIKTQKELNNKGRCLHYEKGQQCNQIAKAHSIQKSQSLAAIAVDRHVYTVSKNFSDFNGNSNRLIYNKKGIEYGFRFQGFCQHHDNELFEPIDNSKLIPTDQQVYLYAYRSLCRAVFVKENALDLANMQIESSVENITIKTYLNSHKLGTSFALDNLKRHKFEYDNSLMENRHSDIEYFLFISAQKPFLAFSGIEYPDFDFMGRQLQDLGDHSSKLDLITFCSAPMKNDEWGLLFAWHKSSSKTCTDFVRSLATMIHDGHNLGDLLFRFVILNCENIAISPTWWETLPEEHRKQISTKIFEMVDDFSPIKPNYLLHGLEGISKWNFDEVISNIEN